jgi:hypothetical protein
MKLDDLRKHLRADLEAEAQPSTTESPVADDVKLEAVEGGLRLAKRCFDCGKPCSYEDEGGPPHSRRHELSIVLCPVCLVKHELVTKRIPTRKCDRCGEDFEIELEVVDEETTCPVCELGPL